MATLWKLGNGAVNGRFGEEWESLWNNPDDNLRIAYRSNIKQLAFDLLMLCVIGNLASYVLGDWADDEDHQALSRYVCEFLQGQRGVWSF
jgi:hypothetical protein